MITIVVNSTPKYVTFLLNKHVTLTLDAFGVTGIPAIWSAIIELGSWFHILTFWLLFFVLADSTKGMRSFEALLKLQVLFLFIYLFYFFETEFMI